MRSAECEAIHRASVILSVENPDLALILMRAAVNYEEWEQRSAAPRPTAAVISFPRRGES